MKILKIAAILTGLALICCLSSGIVSAADPPEPTYDTAQVDGNFVEWDLAFDFFADMYRAGNPDFPVETKLHLRYDCSTNVLYALVLAEENVRVLIYDPIEGDHADDAYIKVDGVKKVDGTIGDDGTPPDFAWIGQYSDGEYIYAEGWEASALVAPGSYLEFNCHTQVFDGGEPQTSAVANRAIALVINCEEVPPPLPSASVWGMTAVIVVIGTLALALLRYRVPTAR